jgi:hypothetical protein
MMMSPDSADAVALHLAWRFYGLVSPETVRRFLLDLLVTELIGALNLEGPPP